MFSHIGLINAAWMIAKAESSALHHAEQEAEPA